MLGRTDDLCVWICDTGKTGNNSTEGFFESYGVDIEKVENTASNDEEELVQDIMMLMAVFSGKLYGRRSAKRRKEKKLQKDLEMQVNNNIIDSKT